jgi:hypothetical protein
VIAHAQAMGHCFDPLVMYIRLILSGRLIGGPHYFVWSHCLAAGSICQLSASTLFIRRPHCAIHEQRLTASIILS